MERRGEKQPGRVVFPAWEGGGEEEEGKSIGSAEAVRGKVAGKEAWSSSQA